MFPEVCDMLTTLSPFSYSLLEERKIKATAFVKILCFLGFRNISC